MTEIPPGKDRASARTEIADRTSRQIADLFDDANSAPAGRSLARWPTSGRHA